MAKATLVVASLVAAVECSTLLWRFASDSPSEQIRALFGYYELVYVAAVVIGVPATVIASIIVGIHGGRPQRLGLISGLLILAGFGAAILALSLPT